MSELRPGQRQLFGWILEASGSVWLALSWVLFAVEALRVGLRPAAGVLIWGVAATLCFLLGELLQWSARRDLEERGEEIPDEWTRTRGTYELLDRHAGEALRTPIVEWFRSDDEVSES